MGRLRGSLGAAAAVMAMVITTITVSGHQSPLVLAWTPYVVVMPVALVGVLCIAASLGSGTALAAAVLVGSFAIQTDVSTAPVVCAFVVVAGIAFVLRKRRTTEHLDSDAEPTRSLSRLPTLVLLTATGVSWIPPLIQEFTGAPGNFTLLTRFFLHQHHADAGLSMSASSAGWAEAVILGVNVPLLATSKLVGLLLLLGVGVVATAVIAGSVRRRDAVALAGGSALALGTVVTVIAGTHIVAPLWSYYLIWVAGIAAIGLLALVTFVSHWSVERLTGSKRKLLVRTWSLTAAACVVGLSVWAFTLPSPSSTSYVPVGSVFRVMAPVVERDAGARIGVSGVGPNYLAFVSGVADELDNRGIPFSVPKALLNHYSAANARSATEWVVLVESPYLMPAGYHRIGVADNISVGYTTTPPKPFTDLPRGPTTSPS
jgi:hypothetical protein